MPTRDDTSILTDPAFCIREAARLVIPISEDNWDLVEAESFDLNVLQAAITHLVYLDTERTEFQQKVMEIVFTAYLMGRTAEERLHRATPDAFREMIAALDLSGLPRFNTAP